MAHNEFSNPEQRMVFRIGITTGEAIIGNVGTNELFNYTAIGDVVNLAQRLQSTAQNGEILIEKTTFDIVSDYVQADTIQHITVKGREQIVQAYTVKDIK
jgi:class 3 adenylate cyclase